MILAVEKGHPKMVEHLVRKGADIEAKNNVSDAMADTPNMYILAVVPDWMDCFDARCRSSPNRDRCFFVRARCRCDDPKSCKWGLILAEKRPLMWTHRI